MQNVQAVPLELSWLNVAENTNTQVKFKVLKILQLPLYYISLVTIVIFTELHLMDGFNYWLLCIQQYPPVFLAGGPLQIFTFVSDPSLQVEYVHDLWAIQPMFYFLH